MKCKIVQLEEQIEYLEDAYTKQTKQLVDEYDNNKSQAAEIDRLKRIIDPHTDKDGNFDRQGFDWKCLEWEDEVGRLKERNIQLELHVETAHEQFAEISKGWIDENKRLKELMQKIDGIASRNDATTPLCKMIEISKALKESEEHNAKR